MGEGRKEGQAIRRPYIELRIRSGKAERQTGWPSSERPSKLRNPQKWAGYLNFEPGTISTLPED